MLMNAQMWNGFTAETLRTVGEDLDLRGIKTFAIKCEADLVVVEGGYQSPPAVTPVTLHYARKDLEELDRKSRERNDYLSATRSFFYLARILSSIGTYVGDKGGRLLSVANVASTETVPVIDIEYETVQNERKFERLTDSDVYALCVRDHKRRGKKPDVSASRYTRFSSLQERSSALAMVIAEQWKATTEGSGYKRNQ